MGNIFNNLYDFIMGLIASAGVYAPLLGCLFIIVESIIPPLPLFVFITINFLAFGKILGFFISWICTVIGCFLSYFLVKKIAGERIVKRISNVKLLNKCTNYIKNMSLVQITVILAIPFTPAFMMNIAAGLVKMDFKKFSLSVIIGKIFLVYFWGFIGTGLLESLHNPKSLIAVGIMTLIAFIMSIILKKVFKID